MDELIIPKAKRRGCKLVLCGEAQTKQKNRDPLIERRPGRSRVKLGGYDGTHQWPTMFFRIKLRDISGGITGITRKVVTTVQSLLYLLPETAQENHTRGILLPICIIAA